MDLGIEPPTFSIGILLGRRHYIPTPYCPYLVGAGRKVSIEPPSQDRLSVTLSFVVFYIES